jgi:hypothetical protein
MKFIQFVKQSNPDFLEKMAGIEQDTLVDLLEKQAEYTVHLLLEKLAEETQEVPGGSPTADPSQTPITGGQENVLMDDNRPSNSIKVNDIKAAVQEAITAGAGEKIIAFVKALAQQNPEAVNEVVKIIKVELHSAFMNKQIDEESAVKISDGLNEILDGGKNE